MVSVENTFPLLIMPSGQIFLSGKQGGKIGSDEHDHLHNPRRMLEVQMCKTIPYSNNIYIYNL